MPEDKELDEKIQLAILKELHERFRGSAGAVNGRREATGVYPVEREAVLWGLNSDGLLRTTSFLLGCLLFKGYLAGDLWAAVWYSLLAYGYARLTQVR